MSFIGYPEYITPDPNQKERLSVTIATQDPKSPSKAVVSTRRKQQIMEVADRKLTRIKLDQQASAALAEAEDMKRIIAIRAKQKEAKFTLHEKQEAVRAPQFQIDQRPVLILLLVLTGIMFAASAILSADGTIGASTAAHYGVGWFGYLLFGAVEVAILVFMLAYYILGSRTDYEGQPIPAGQWFFAMIVASALAVALSVYHVLDLDKFNWTSVSMWVGVAIRLSVTVFFVVCSKAAATILFAKPVNL